MPARLALAPRTAEGTTLKNAHYDARAAAIAGTLVTTSPAGIANADARRAWITRSRPGCRGLDPNRGPGRCAVDLPPAPEDARGFDPCLPRRWPGLPVPACGGLRARGCSVNLGRDRAVQGSGGNWSISTGNGYYRRPAVHRRHLAMPTVAQGPRPTRARRSRSRVAEACRSQGIPHLAGLRPPRRPPRKDAKLQIRSVWELCDSVGNP